MIKHKDGHFNEFEDSLFQNNVGQKSNSTWALSFADIVTVLLCFFMIFYIIEKKYKKKVDYDLSKIAIQNYSTHHKTPEIQQFIETIEELPEIKIEKKNQFLEVHFPPEVFYESGSTKLSHKGKKLIQAITKPLLSVKNQYYLQIQGYADSTKVKKLKHRWWQDNMQLSIQRALGVYYILINKGVNKNLLSVTGFGANKPLEEEKLGPQRRISLKFEPVLRHE